MNVDKDKIESIKKILAKYHLELILPIKNIAHKERFFVLKAKREDGLVFTIKYLRLIETAEEDALLKFKNEVLFLEYIDRHKVFNKQMTQKLLAYNLSEGWRIADYFSGEKISNEDDFYTYDPKLLAKISPQEIVDLFFNLQQINTEKLKMEIPLLPEYGLKKHQEYYRKMEPAGYILDNLMNNKYNFLTKVESARLLKIYINPGQNYFSKTGVIHSDLNPENIIVSRDNQFYILDWENVGIGPKFSDFVNFWTRCHLNPIFQKDIFLKMQEKYPNKEEFLENFNKTFLISFLGIYEYYCLNRSLKRINDEDFEKAIKFLMETYAKVNEYDKF